MEWLVRHSISIDEVVYIKIFILMIVSSLRVFYPLFFDKYITLPYSRSYIHQHTMMSKSWPYGFNFLLFGGGVLSISLFVWYLVDYRYIEFQSAFFDQTFFNVFLLILFFFSGKMLLKTLVFIFFDLRQTFKPIVFSSIAYFSYGGLILYLFTIIFFDNYTLPRQAVWIPIILFGLITIYGEVLNIIRNKKLVETYYLYYLLYLCALDIAPFWIAYKLLF